MTDPFRSQRLLYRAIEDNDTDTTFIHTLQSDALAYANSNPTLPRPQSRAQSARYKHHLMDKTLLAVIICLVPPAPAPDSPASPPTPIGAISLTAPRPGHEHHRTSNISVDIGAEYRRRGYGSEAIRWVLGWAFGAAGLHRVGVEGYSWNEGAVRLYEGLGFRLEGTLRESVWFRGGWHDYLSFGMLEGEWEERRGEGEGSEPRPQDPSRPIVPLHRCRAVKDPVSPMTIARDGPPSSPHRPKTPPCASINPPPTDPPNDRTRILPTTHQNHPSLPIESSAAIDAIMSKSLFYANGVDLRCGLQYRLRDILGRRAERPSLELLDINVDVQDAVK